VQHLVTKHTTAATTACPSLRGKTVTPHTLRHTTAMTLLHAGVDIAVIALWLGHESTETTQIYLHADRTIKERALARTTPPSGGAPAATTPPTPCWPSSTASDPPALCRASHPDHQPPHHR
jgi:hypothetical protein